MPSFYIALIVIGVIFILSGLLYLINVGVKLCKKNNALGIVLLFIPLNLLGILLGICLIYNARNSNKNIKEPLDLLKKEDKISENLEIPVEKEKPHLYGKYNKNKEAV